jgi:hypothetical protein
MKIFVIGFNKTGTTSIHDLFIKLDINSCKVPGIEILNIIHKYDAFTDGEHYNFREYYDKCPNGLFILNTRPISNWLISRYKHAKIHAWSEECWCWPVSNEKTNTWISDRETHYKNILDFFVNKPKQLFIVNIEKKGWENAVLNFLQKNDNITVLSHNKTIINKIQKGSLKIHENIRPNHKIRYIKHIKNNVSHCLKKRGYLGNELLIKDLDLNKYTTFL